MLMCSAADGSSSVATVPATIGPALVGEIVVGGAMLGFSRSSSWRSTDRLGSLDAVIGEFWRTASRAAGAPSGGKA